MHTRTPRLSSASCCCARCFGLSRWGPALTNLTRRAALVATQLVGLAFVRYVLKVEPVASASPAELIPVVGPTLQRYLGGQLS